MATNENEIVVSSEAISDTSTVQVSSITDAQLLLTEMFSELKSFEQAKAAQETSFDILIRRAIYAINKETPPDEQSAAFDSILPGIDNEGSMIERIQFISSSIEVALSVIQSDPNISSLLDE